MAKIIRYDGNLLGFGANATGTNRTVFGDVTQSDTLDDNVNADYFLGWEIIVASAVPPKQDFNGLAFTLGQLLAYLHQVGVPEWQADQEFHINSFTNRNGILYVSKINTNIGNDPATDDGANWVDANTLNANLSASTLTHDMASDADYILSIAENRNGRVVITDTGVNLTTARNIVVSNTGRTFFAQNDTLQTLVFKTSVGTGISVAAGGTGLVLCDGTNVIDPVPSTGLMNVVTIAASGTYDKPAGLKFIEVIAKGAGAAGGGVDGQGAASWAAGGGGGQGAKAYALIMTADLSASETVTIGAEGTGVAGDNPGNDGGTTSFGTHAIAEGGIGGDGRLGGAVLALAAGGERGTATAGDELDDGSPGHFGVALAASTSNANSGAGGGEGGGVGVQGDQAGVNGTSPRAGGSGAVSTGTSTDFAGGNGFRGEITIKEHF